jgi:phage repressor protein C with HTH and peptisase S24 domain
MNKLERLNDAVAYLKGVKIIKNQQDIVDRMNVNKASVSQVFNGKKNYLTDSFLRKFNRAFDDIFNEDWLLTGKGKMLNSTTGYGSHSISIKGNSNSNIANTGNISIKSVAREPVEPYRPADRNSYAGVPLIPVEAMAGFGEGDASVMEYDIAERYVVPDFNNQVDFMIRVKGSSMYPKYSSGDVVACKKIPTQTFFQWNKVYVMDTVQGPLVKRIAKSANEECVTCVSENPKYEPFDLPKSEIRSLSIVLGVIRLE